MPVGKPKRTISSLPEGWYDYILEEMNQGASLQEIKAHFDISNTLHERWMDEEPEYKETIKRGIELSHAWWQKQGRVHLQNKDFSATLWYMNMKNRFGWKDRQDITSDDKSISPVLVEFVTKDETKDTDTN